MSRSLFRTLFVLGLFPGVASAAGEELNYEEVSVPSGGSFASTGFVVATDYGAIRTAFLDMSPLSSQLDSFAHTNLGLWDPVEGVRLAQQDFAYRVDTAVLPNRLRVTALGLNELFQPVYAAELASVELPEVENIRSTAGGLPIIDGRIYSWDGSQISDRAAPAGFSIFDSIAGDWAIRNAGGGDWEVYAYDASEDDWDLQTTLGVSDDVEFGSPAIDAQGNCAFLYRQSNFVTAEVGNRVRFFRREPGGGWTDLGLADFPEGTLGVQGESLYLTGDYLVCNRQGMRYVVYGVGSGGLTQLEVYERGAFGQPVYWVHPRADGQLVRYRSVSQFPFQVFDVFPAADTAEVPASGGTQVLELNHLDTYVDFQFLWLGSVSGTSPGVPYGGLQVDLNPDAYFNYLLQFAGNTNITGQVGLLDSSGQATATVVIPPVGPELVGLELRHAALGFRPDDGSVPAARVQFVTDPIPLVITGP